MIVNKMEDIADFIGGYWVIKEECNGKELIFNCPLEYPIVVPDNTSSTLKIGGSNEGLQNEWRII